jgi:hypothetical protein
MLQNFGTALSREQMKHILGGDEEEIPGGGGGDENGAGGCTCTHDSHCSSSSCNKPGAKCKSYNSSNVCVFF